MCRATAGLATTKTYQAPNKPALHGNKGDYRDFFESCRALKVTPSCGQNWRGQAVVQSCPLKRGKCRDGKKQRRQPGFLRDPVCNLVPPVDTDAG